jgi:prevent-host-death family protein
MCYMVSVGVRELRQNASELLDRVQAGESFEITNHGRPVAQLVAINRRTASSYNDLVAQGVLRPGRGDPLAVIPVEPEAGSPTTDQLLAMDRYEDA